MKDLYSATGPYDFVAVIEAPADETASRLALLGGAQGSMRSETMRAFTEEEYRRIIGALP